MALSQSLSKKALTFFLQFLLNRLLLVASSAGWSSPVARQAHNLKVAGSNPAPATNF